MPSPKATVCVYRGFVLACSVAERKLRVRQYAVDPKLSCVFHFVGESEQAIEPLTTASGSPLVARYPFESALVACYPFDEALALILECATTGSVLAFKWREGSLATQTGAIRVCRSGPVVACAADCLAWYEATASALCAERNGCVYFGTVKDGRGVGDVVCGQATVDFVAVIARRAGRLVCLRLSLTRSAAKKSRSETVVEEYALENLMTDIIVKGELKISFSDGFAKIASASFGVSPKGLLLDLDNGAKVLLLDPPHVREVRDVLKLGDRRSYAVLYADLTVHIAEDCVIKAVYTSVQYFLAGDLLHRGFDLMMIIWNDKLESEDLRYLLTDYNLIHRQRLPADCSSVKGKGHSMAADALKARLEAAESYEVKLQSIQLHLEHLISRFCRTRSGAIVKSRHVGLKELVSAVPAEDDVAAVVPPVLQAPPAMQSVSVQAIKWSICESSIVFQMTCLSIDRVSIIIQCDAADEFSYESSIESLPSGKPLCPLKTWSIISKASLPTFLSKAMRFHIMVLSGQESVATTTCTEVVVSASDLAKPEKQLLANRNMLESDATNDDDECALDFVQSRKDYVLTAADEESVDRLLQSIGFTNCMHKSPSRCWSNKSACAFYGMRCKLPQRGSLVTFARDALQHSIFAQILGHLVTPTISSSVMQSSGRVHWQLVDCLSTAASDLSASTDEATQLKALPGMHKRLQKPKRQPLQAVPGNSRGGADATAGCSLIECLKRVEALLIEHAAVATTAIDR